MRRTIGMALIGLVASAAALAQDAPQRSAEAVAIAERAAEALGGAERLRAAGALRYHVDGPARIASQGPAPDEPADYRYHVDFALSFADGRAVVTTGFAFGPSRFESTRHLDGETVRGANEIARHARLSPHAILDAFLDEPASLTLISRDPDTDVIAGVLGRQLLRVHIDRQSGLVERVVWPIDDPRHGDALAQASFADYREAEGWRLPGRVRSEEAGHEVFDLAFEIYALGAGAMPVTASDEAPASPGPGRGSPPGDSHVFGNGVVALYDVAGADYHSLAVQTEDGGLLIEAPGSIGDGLSLLRRASEALGGPVTLVASTHHHGDHSGGFPGAVSQGADAIVAAGHAGYFHDAATAPRSFSPVRFDPVEEITLHTVPAGGRLEIGGRVIAYDVGNVHSREHLVFFVPDAGVLFQSDMAVFLWDGSVEPARDQACRLLAFLEAEQLPVRTIVGGHGRPGTLEDLRAAVALRETPCPAR